MLLLIIFTALFVLSLTGFITFYKLNDLMNKKYWDVVDKLRPLEYKDDNFTDSERVKYQQLKKEEKKYDKLGDKFDDIKDTFKIFLTGASILFIGWGLITLMCVNPYAIEKCRIANQIKYDAIIFELKSIEIRDGLNIRDKDVFDDVIDWNTEYAQHVHANQNIFWGINSSMKEYEGMGSINVEDYFIVWEEPNE